ncbi:MAG: WbqC family protein [Chitinispirillales bacterium]|jgi:hypothetical protein|nr:WbqC family protein [Chitinispirillales bacterium]
MKLGIMQPYFLPYIGYFSLIKHVDNFILFDTVQFIRHGWIERNRILKPNKGWQYIQVPLIKKDGRNTLIKDVEINNNENWQNKILAQLKHYKKKAPNYFKVISLLDDIFSQRYEDIVSLNKVSLEKILLYLGIEKKIKVFSKMDLQIDEVNAPDEWALNVCKAIEGVNEYCNPPGGQGFFDKSKYDKSGIKLKFQKVTLTEYSQNRDKFEAGLSILDVMMFNSADVICEMLQEFELV